MQRILIGTRNLKKKREIAEILAGVPVELLSLADWSNVPPVVEDGATFRDNAVKKATALADATGQWVLADDSGIEVNALGGRPGVLSARYAGPHATDQENNARLLRELEGVPASERGARYVCVIALAKPGELLGVVEGTCRGVIATEPRGASGFGYDPIFFVPQLGKTFAEVPPAQKHALSHRGQALQALRQLLTELLKMHGRSGYEDQPWLAELYDPWLEVRGAGDVPMYLEMARSTGGPALELACGTGRVLLPLAEAGFQVVGLDLSEHMLARCREKLGRLPEAVQERVRLYRGNMADFDLQQTFRLILIPIRSFQHLLGVDEQLACLRCVQRHLAPGGRLVLDVFQLKPERAFDPKYLIESAARAELELPDGRKVKLCERTAAMHRAEQYNEVEMIWYVTHPDGRTERLVHAFPFRYFFRYEMEHLLARAGLRVAELFGDYDKTPLAADSPEMIFVAEKLPERSH